jgi:hypothetical protein
MASDWNWWLTPAVYIGVSLVVSEASLRRVKARGGVLVFRPSILLRLILATAGIAISVVLYGQWARTEWLLDAAAVLFLLWIFFGWPKTIITDENGIECRWLWRRRVRIPWNEVECAETGSVGRIEVVGTHARIKFEGYNLDPKRFRNELLKRSKVESLIDPNEFTGLNLE